jgi:hypothetical protein
MEVNEQMEYNSFQQFEPAPRRGEVQVCMPLSLAFCLNFCLPNIVDFVTTRTSARKLSISQLELPHRTLYMI